VLVDGKALGSIAAGSTLVLPGVAEGERIVTLQYSDNQETRKLVVYPDVTNAVSFAYRQESFATVAFEGFPDGAVIYSAGRELGTIAAGRFTAGGLAPGPRSFSVYHEAWAAPYLVAVDAAARATATAAFKGGRIVALSVPRNVQIAVDGKIVGRSDGLRDEYDLGLFPEGSHSVSFTGDNWDQQRLTASVTHGATARVTASMTMRPGSTAGSGTAASGGYGGGSGFGALRIRNDSGLGEGLEVRVRKNGDDEALPFLWDQVNVLSAGDYVVEARRVGDPDWAFSKAIAIVSGAEDSVVIPAVEYSTTWRIADLELQREAAVMGLEQAVRAAKARRTTSNVGLTIGLVSLGLTAYGVVDSVIAIPIYEQGTDPVVLTALHRRLNLDTNFVIFGGSASIVSTLIWTVRFYGRKHVGNAQELVDRIDEALDSLRNPR